MFLHGQMDKRAGGRTDIIMDTWREGGRKEGMNEQKNWLDKAMMG